MAELYKISQKRKLTDIDFSETMNKISLDFYQKLKELKEVDTEVKIKEEMERLKGRLAEVFHW